MNHSSDDDDESVPRSQSISDLAALALEAQGGCVVNRIQLKSLQALRLALGRASPDRQMLRLTFMTHFILLKHCIKLVTMSCYWHHTVCASRTRAKVIS